MNTLEKKYACTSPYLLWGCIISCTICTIVMIWGVVLMMNMNHSMSSSMISEKQISSSSMDNTAMNHSMMDMSDPMSMSMADMGKMLEGQTGDALDKAFLEGMIPHHQGAIDMAKYLEKSARPELQKLGKDIIVAQKGEIEQMQKWLKEWNLTITEATQTSTDSMMKMDDMIMPTQADGDEAMREHCKMMSQMAGCEVYK